MLPTISFATQVTLQWDASNQTPDGYCVYQRQPGGTYDYTNPIWPADGKSHTETSCTITGLTEGAFYNFVVRAHAGGDFSGDSNEVTYQVPVYDPNQTPAPIAEAGANQSVQSGASVIINGRDSYDPDGSDLKYQWVQSSGPAVVLKDADKAQSSFLAPNVSDYTTLSFEVSVTNGSGISDADTCLVLVGPSQQHPDNDNDGTPDFQDLDDDNDGMPDVWENQYGLNSFVNDANADADHDNLPNYQEYQDGTNPTTRAGNEAPAVPIVTSPANGETGLDAALWLNASDFDDPDPLDSHKWTQWQISAGQSVVLDLTVTKKNLTEVKVPRMVLDPSTQYSVRVRYYDNYNEASPWSDATTFTTAQDEKDKNKNRVPDSQEVSHHADVNRDGTPDINQDAFIKSIQTYDHQHLMGISIESTANAAEVASAENLDPMFFEEQPYLQSDMAYGLLGYKVHVDQPGDSMTTTIYLSDPIDQQSSWACYDSVKGWRDCTSTTAVDDQGLEVQRRLTDGGTEDADGTANGVIVDLSGPGVVPSGGDGNSNLAVSDGGTAASGSGSGGCFIGSIFAKRK